MLYLLKGGNVMYCANEDPFISWEEIEASDGNMETILVEPELILHNIGQSEIGLEHGYTFHDFCLMMMKYTALQLLNVHTTSYLQDMIEHKDKIANNEIKQLGGWMGVYKNTRSWQPNNKISSHIEMRHYDQNIYDYVFEQLENNQLTVHYLEQNGGSLDFCDWKSLLTCKIIILPEVYLGDMQNEESTITFYEFLLAMFDDLAFNDLKNTLATKSQLQKDIDSDDVVEVDPQLFAEAEELVKDVKC